jgi:hypothetical protein
MWSLLKVATPTLPLQAGILFIVLVKENVNHFLIAQQIYFIAALKQRIF